MESISHQVNELQVVSAPAYFNGLTLAEMFADLAVDAYNEGILSGGTVGEDEAAVR